MIALSDDFRRMLAQSGLAMFRGLAEELESGSPVTAVRFNASKKSVASAAFPVAEGERVPWCQEGLILAQRPDFTLDPLMHQGVYYVQDPSSMFISRLVRLLAARVEAEGIVPSGEPLRYLDACAAPGGKTTAAVAALPDSALVVANEYDFRRAEILKENVIKWGSGNVVVSRGDTARFRRLPAFFHIVAADVPCSGEGMMRKDLKARSQWSPSLVAECAARQREIVENLWETLVPGGYLIYSTCTFNTSENEEVLRHIVSQLGGEIIPPESFSEPGWGIESTGSMLRFLPTVVKGEGLAVGVIRKPADALVPSVRAKMRKGGARRSQLIPQWVNECLDGDFCFSPDESGSVWGVPQAHAPYIPALENTLDVICKGSEVAAVKGKGFIPAHGLAMSWHLRRNLFPSVELTLADALTYLRRESTLGFDAPRGPVLLTYGNLPLGFVNNLGSRANNLYPQNWRILKQCF